MKRFKKQPSDILDYDIDLSEWLSSGDNVIAADVTVPSGLTLDHKTVTDDRVKIWLADGVDGTTYKVTTRITTEDGRNKEVDFEIKVRDE